MIVRWVTCYVFTRKYCSYRDWPLARLIVNPTTCSATSASSTHCLEWTLANWVVNFAKSCAKQSVNPPILTGNNKKNSIGQAKTQYVLPLPQVGVSNHWQPFAFYTSAAPCQENHTPAICEFYTGHNLAGKKTIGLNFYETKTVGKHENIARRRCRILCRNEKLLKQQKLHERERARPCVCAKLFKDHWGIWQFVEYEQGCTMSMMYPNITSL